MATINNMPYNPTFNRDPRGNYEAHRDASFVSVQAGTDALLLEDEVNELQWLGLEGRHALLRALGHTGFLHLGYTDNTSWREGLGVDLAQALANPSTLLLHPNSMRASVNGDVVDLYLNTTATPYALLLPAPPSSNVTALPGSARDDLVFLELWLHTVTPSSQVYDYGFYGGSSLVNDLVDSRIQAPTTQRVQLRWNLRVVPGVNFALYPEGFARYGASMTGSPAAQCQLSAPDSAWVYHQPNPTTDPQLAPALWSQKGLYLAGDGSATAQAALGTVDGYAYALPLFRVRRRNTAAWSPTGNPLGGAPYVTQLTSSNAIYPQGTVTLTLQSTAGLLSGQVVTIAGTLNTYETTLTNVNYVNNTVTFAVGLPAAQAVTSVTTVCDRPDGLFNNVVYPGDVVDLRHRVVWDGTALGALRQQGTEALLKGTLGTHLGTTVVRDLMGVPTLTDDADTVLLASLNNTLVATSDGTALPLSGTVSASSYVSSPIGLGYEVLQASAAPTYAVTLGTTASFSLECLLATNWYGQGNYGLFALAQASGTLDLSVTATPQALTLNYLTSTGQVTASWGWTGAQQAALSSARTWHKLLLTMSTAGLTASLDNVPLNPLTPVDFLGDLAAQALTAQVGAVGSLGLNGVLADVRFSTVVRQETQLPLGFNGAMLDTLRCQPSGNLDTFGANVNTATSLSHVPAYVEGALSYDNVTVPQYLSAQGAWAPPVNPVTDEAPGTWDHSALSVGVGAVSNGGTVTVAAPPVTPVNAGVFLVPLAGTVSTSTGTTVDVDLAVSFNAGTVGTAYVATQALPTGTAFTVPFSYGNEHVHLLPSTQGWAVHNWHDDSFGIQYLSNPSVAATLTALTGGSLPGGSGTTYYVAYTWYTAYGETLPTSSIAQLTLTTGYSSLGISVPNVPSGAEGTRIYVGESPTDLVLAATISTTTFTLINYPTDTQQPPTQNTALTTNPYLALSQGIVDGRVLTINHVGVTLNGSNTRYVIPPAGLPANTLTGQPTAFPAWSVVNGSGAALTLPNNQVNVTFAGWLPNNAIVDVVYEYSLMPQPTDTLFFCYTSAPYQGLLGSEVALSEQLRLPVLDVASRLLVSTNGTGAVTPLALTGLPSYAYVPLSTRLPLPLGVGGDHLLTNSTLAFTNDTTAFTRPVANANLRLLGYEVSDVNTYPADGTLDLVGNVLSGLGTGTLTPRGLTAPTAALTTPVGNPVTPLLYHSQGLTAASNKVVVLAALVQLAAGNNLNAYNDELLLLVITAFDSTASASLGLGNGWYDVAYDLFHLPGRPLYRT